MTGRSAGFFAVCSSFLLCANAGAAERDFSSIGMEQYAFAVPGKAHAERCIVSKRFPIGQTKYKKRDLKQERKLCSHAFHVAPDADEKGALSGTCPKINSTSAGIDIYQLPGGKDLTAFRREVCHLPIEKKKALRAEKGYPVKAAKFKLSSSGISAGSMLGYYHLSRYLGVGNGVPVVIRTVDRDFAVDVDLAGRFIARTVPVRKTLRRHYDQLLSHYLRRAGLESGSIPESYRTAERALGIVPESYRKRSKNWSITAKHRTNFGGRFMTADNAQVFGVISKNPRGEASYDAFFHRKMAGYKSFVTYKLLKKNVPIGKILKSRDLATSGQTLKRMIDLAGVMVIDYLFGTSDRAGNTHKFVKYYYKDSDGVVRTMRAKRFKRLKKKDAAELTEKDRRRLTAIPIEELLIKDNDSGFDLNKVKKYRLIEPIRHMDPFVYARVIELDAALSGQRAAELERFFIDEMLFTKREFKKLKDNAASLKALLAKMKAKGKLRLDLDFQAFFGKRHKSAAQE